ncbi:hypothetical protein SCAR479_02094 [Seiridium cardinale]|uniref:Uncharacterized protein n=1 Tax=Seiridium cardinale TaxID=138064 RepID=A0ABR2Y491_9PEZI
MRPCILKFLPPPRATFHSDVSSSHAHHPRTTPSSTTTTVITIITTTIITTIITTTTAINITIINITIITTTMKFNQLLIDYLPKAGMLYKSNVLVLSRNARDANLLRALKTASLIGDGKVSEEEFKQGKENVKEAIVAIFAAAADPNLIGLIRSGDLLDFESKLRECVPWAVAAAVSDSVFTEFLHALVNARQQWRRYPRAPFDVSQHSPAVLQIDAFLGVAGDDWARAEANHQVYEMAGGFEEDEEEDGDEEMAELGNPVSSSSNSNNDDDDNAAAATTTPRTGDEETLASRLDEMDLDD